MARRNKNQGGGASCSVKREVKKEHPGKGEFTKVRHIQRDHRCCGLGSATGTCDYRTNGKSAKMTDYEVHHILCHSSVNKYPALFPDDKARNIATWITHTDWCLNQRANLIPLPLRSEYVNFQKADFVGAPLNLVCHNWDHNCNFGYTHEVTKEVRSSIFERLTKPYDEKDCPETETVKVGFENLAEDFREMLQERGSSRPGVGGTSDVLKKIADKSKPEGVRQLWWKENKAWRPFSMAGEAVASERPVSYFGAKPRWQPNYKTRLKHLA